MPEFRADSYATPDRCAAVYKLVATAWPRLAECIPATDAVCEGWKGISTPFVMWEGDKAVAHAGLLAFELVVNGEVTPVGGIHAVVTHPGHRGRGLMREVMERALAYADERFPTTMLFGDPPMYERFGFRHVARHEFCAPAPKVEKVEPFRPLDDDIEFLRGLLESRTPVSHRLGVVRTSAMFFCNCVLSGANFKNVWRTNDYAVAYVVSDRKLILLDVMARELPSLEEIIARIPHEIDTVRFDFCPDRFDVAGVVAESFDEDPVMVRGEWPLGDEPFEFPFQVNC